MSLTKINELANKGIISSLDNQPVLTAAELKGKFDEASDNIIDYINKTLTTEIDEELLNKQDVIQVTSGRALVSGASGDVTASPATSAELSYLSGVTSPIQAQLNAKQEAVSLTSDKVVITNNNGSLTASAVSASNLRDITYGADEPSNEDGLPVGSIYLKVVE